DPLIARARKPIPPEWLGAPPSGNEVGSGAAEKPTPSAIRQAGRFCIEGEIGTGGMGVVYRAFDPDIRRSVAVKELQERHFGRRPDLEYRFLEEAQLAGQLQHPGVPAVYEIGRLPDGRPFYAMKLVEGQTLAELLEERRTPSDDLPRFVAIFGQLCQALAY